MAFETSPLALAGSSHGGISGCSLQECLGLSTLYPLSLYILALGGHSHPRNCTSPSSIGMGPRATKANWEGARAVSYVCEGNLCPVRTDFTSANLLEHKARCADHGGKVMSVAKTMYENKSLNWKVYKCLHFS